MPDTFDEPFDIGETSRGGGLGGGGTLSDLLRGGSFAVPGAQSFSFGSALGGPDDGYSPRRRSSWEDILGPAFTGANQGNAEGDLWGDLFGGGRPNNPTEAKYWSPYDRILNELIGNAGKAGLFDPLGSPAMRDAIRSQVMSDSLARGRALQMRARSDASVDPSSYGSLALQAQLEGGRNTASALANADLSQMTKVGDWLRQLAVLPLADRLNYHNAWMQHWMSNEVANRNKGTLLDYLGGIIGTGIGGLLPGGGGGVPGTDISPPPQTNYWPDVPDPWGTP